MDNGTFYDLDTIEALGFCVQLGLTAFTSLIPYSLSVATFLVFWAMDREKWTGFFRTLAIGLVLVLPLSAMTYYYDWFVRPQMMVVSVGKIVEMKQTYPNSLADKYGISMEQILNKKPMSMSKTKLTAQIDSLETSFQADIDTCGLLLSILPDTLASKAYDCYRLKKNRSCVSIRRSSCCQRRQSDIHSTYRIVPARIRCMGNIKRAATS
ncbi:MAG: hypothetical protein ACLTOV_12675 [Phocaeicola sp.]